MEKKNTIIIEFTEDMEQLIGVLTRNGYSVNAYPVYETEEDAKKQQRYINRNIRPRIKHYVVETTGIVAKPIYCEE
jgi:hypothetical protein